MCQTQVHFLVFMACSHCRQDSFVSSWPSFDESRPSFDESRPSFDEFCLVCVGSVNKPSVALLWHCGECSSLLTTYCGQRVITILCKNVGIVVTVIWLDCLMSVWRAAGSNWRKFIRHEVTVWGVNGSRQDSWRPTRWDNDRVSKHVSWDVWIINCTLINAHRPKITFGHE